MNPDELLLRDIHLPEPVSWWPPAIGWWLVTVFAVFCIAAAIVWLQRRKRLRSAPATLARAELERLQTRWSTSQDTQWLVSEISTWLRRASMSLDSRRSAASLTGNHWQQYLNELAGETVFAADDGSVLTATPYRGTTLDVSDGERLLQLCRRWLDATERQGARR